MSLVEIRVGRGKYVFVFRNPRVYSASVTVVVEGERIFVDTDGFLVDHEFIGNCVSKSLECVKDIGRCVKEIQSSKLTHPRELEDVVLEAVKIAAEGSALGCVSVDGILQELASRGVQINKEKLLKVINRLKRMGDVYEKREDCYAAT